MKKDDIKTFAVIIIVCIVCVALVLFFGRKTNFDKLEEVNEYNNFFSSINYANNYVSYLSSRNNTALYSILDDKYIEDNEISEGNILEYTKEYPDLSSVKVDSISYIELSGNYLYYLKGKIYENGFEDTTLIDDDFRILVLIDISNKSYSIYPVDNKNYKRVINSIKKINIIANNYNSILEENLITKEKVCVFYLSDFIDRVIYDTQKSYLFISDSMKREYNTFELYNDFINSNKSKITTVVDKCLAENIGDNRFYTVIDGNGNCYKFKEKNILNYTVDIYFK